MSPEPRNKLNNSNRYKVVKLEDFKEGISVDGVLADHLVTVIHVKWFGAEGGAHFNCESGWKCANCLNGDWEAYLALLLQWKAKVDEWNTGHGNRYLGQVLFTTGGAGWASWEIQALEMRGLADVL